MANIFERRIDKILDLGLTDANGIILQLNNRFCDRDTCRWKLHNMDLIHSVINDLLFVFVRFSSISSSFNFRKEFFRDYEAENDEKILSWFAWAS